MTPDLTLLETVTLLPGGHASPRVGLCAMEAIALAMGLPHSDVPPCTDAPLARAFQRVNDWHGWRSDEARTEFLRPYLMRLGRLAVEGKRAPLSAYGFASADIAVRVFAPRALEARFPDRAAALRGLLPVTDGETARAAAAAAAAARTVAFRAAVAGAGVAGAGAAAYAADAAAYATADAAANAANAANAAANAANAAAAYATAATAAAYEDLAGQLLTRLLDVCEAGRWPLEAP
jgi:hypothetical protein